MKNPFKKNLKNDQLRVAYNTGFITPKRIIMDAIKTRLGNTGIKKLILIFPTDNDYYNVMLKNETGESTKFEIDKTDINLIKKIFVKRLINSWNEKNDIEVKSIIIQIDIDPEIIEVFINDYKEKIHKFDF